MALIVVLSAVCSGLAMAVIVLYRQRRVTTTAEAELRKAVDEANLASKTKDDLLANVTHELRSPLGAILGYAELLKSSEISAGEKYDYLQSVIRNGRHLLDIVNDILDLSKVEAGQLNIEKVTFSLHLELLNIVASYKKQAARKGLKINLGYEFPIPECITSDPVRVRQILINLVSNAIKFSSGPDGEITLGVAASDHQLVIRVKDTGIGMSEAQQKRLFQPFVQADSSVSRKFGGTGLGLSLSRKLARALGGDLRIEKSEPGFGSIFRLTLDPGELKTVRKIKSYKEMSNIPLPSVIDKQEAALEDLHVLIVEDSKDNQTIYVQYLESAGATVDVASNGREGFKKAMEKDFNLILMDIQMPIEDGYTTTARLRQKNYLRPIVALTANAMKGERERCIQAGCDDYLTKPVDPDTLIEIIAWLTKKKSIAKTSANILKKVSYLSDIRQEDLTVPRAMAAEVRSIYGHDPRVSKVIGEFIGGIANRLASIREALEKGNFKEAASLAHNLRGTSATYGFPELAALAEKLELEALSSPPNKACMAGYVHNIAAFAGKMVQ